MFTVVVVAADADSSFVRPKRENKKRPMFLLQLTVVKSSGSTLFAIEQILRSWCFGDPFATLERMFRIFACSQPVIAFAATLFPLRTNSAYLQFFKASLARQH